MTYGGSLVVLNVAEKPSVARALASVFSQIPQSRDQPPIRGQAAQIFVIDNVQFPSVLTQGTGNLMHGNGNNTSHKMIVTSVRGHLASQDFPQNYGWSSCPPISLFDAPIETFYKNDMQPLQRMLKNQSRNVDAVILWLDCDREGEAICDEVRTVCLESNQRLKEKIYRAKFSTVLPQEINRALRSLGRINENFVQAVQARSEHDLRVGAAFTRFQTLRLQKKFEEFASGSSGVVSYGPCQFPTLGFVVERWARIETFIPQNFWYLDMTINVNEDGTITGQTQNENIQPNNDANANNLTMSDRNKSRQIVLKWQRERLYDRGITLALFESCLDVGEAVVVSLTGRPKNKWRPIPLATVELQKRASRYLRIGSESLMSAAEELYQQGLISYPRTETEKFRPEFQHRPLIESFQGIGGELGEYSTKLLRDNNFQNPRAGQNDDAAHPPITPCKAVHPDSIPDLNQRKVYSLIVKHYLACCSRDALGKETVLKVKMASEEFSAKGLMILERNWLEIYSWEKWYTGHGELPNVQVGSRFRPSSLLMKDGQTAPPQLISEVELISLMDRNGIGTDATIAQHITTIQERNYAEKNGAQKFSPTKLGIALVEGYNSMGYQLNRPDLRREMEAECNAVATGRKRKEEIMQPILTKMRECFEKASAEALKLDDAIARHFTRIGSNNNNSSIIRGNFSKCGSCEGFLSLKELTGTNNHRGNRGNTRSNPRLLHCSTCSVGFRLPSKGIPTALTQNNRPQSCPICQYQVLKITQGDGYTGNGYHICPKCFNDAPIEYGGAATSGEFRCFNCTHPTCTLASGTRSGDAKVYPCPFCAANGTSSKITLRKNSRGYILSCSNNNATTGGVARCDYKIWLPKAATSITIAESSQSQTNNSTTNGANLITCNHCSNPTRTVNKLSFRWNPNKIPPGIPTQQIACILCDEGLKADFQISLPQLNQVQVNRGRQQRARTPPPSANSTSSSTSLSSGSRNTNTYTHQEGSYSGGVRGRGRVYASHNSSGSRSRSRDRIFPNSANNNQFSTTTNYNAGRGRGRSTSNASNNEVRCYKCGQLGHYSSNCPN